MTKAKLAEIIHELELEAAEEQRWADKWWKASKKEGLTQRQIDGHLQSWHHCIGKRDGLSRAIGRLKKGAK